MASEAESATSDGVGRVAGNTHSDASVHILMIPFPSHPHIVPMLHLAHHVVECGSIIVTFVSFQVLIDRLVEEESRRERPREAIRLVGVPDDLPGFSPPNTMFIEGSLLAHNLRPLVLKILDYRRDSGLQGPTCLLTDSMLWWSTDVASELKIPRYVLSANPACFQLCMLSCVENAPNGYKEEEGCGKMTLIDIPGLPPLHWRNIPRACRYLNGPPKFTPPIRDLFTKSLRESKGILVNTCYELESGVIDTLRMKLPHIPVFPVGPLGQLATSVAKNVSLEGLHLSDEEEVTTWLDKQPPASVVYVCFGTTGMIQLAERHFHEMAKGLEASHERFLWVLRAPPGVEDVDELLPQGFEERVKGRGILVRGWAPQLQILAHPSTGAFLSSCGWNSSVESLARGVPIIGWPSFADQPIICGYMVSKLKVAVELSQETDNFVDAKEIGKAVRLVLQSEEGKCMRERAGQYKTIIAAALAGRGSPLQNVQEFANFIRRTPPK